MPRHSIMRTLKYIIPKNPEVAYNTKGHLFKISLAQLPPCLPNIFVFLFYIVIFAINF